MTQPWMPITDPATLKRLGKLNEELGECTSASARCLIQGFDGTEPDTGKVNRQWLLEELADVEAQAVCTLDMLKLSEEESQQYEERRNRKIKQMLEWEAMM